VELSGYPLHSYSMRADGACQFGLLVLLQPSVPFHLSLDSGRGQSCVIDITLNNISHCDVHH